MPLIKPINIILVDNENICRYGVIALIKKTEISVIAQAENGDELLELLKTKKPDLILLDLEMPIMNGSQTLTRLRKDYPHLKVVILSKYHDEELIKDMFNRGACAFVSKCADLEIIPTAIRRVAEYGIFKDNVPCLLKTPSFKDRHYYKLILTPREITIMGSIYESKPYKEIAKSLFISEKTVENHAKSIYKKMNVKTRSEFSIVMSKLGLNYMCA